MADKEKKIMKLTKYDKERLTKWANIQAWEYINRGININPFLRAANDLSRDCVAVARDIGGDITPEQVKRFYVNYVIKL